MRFVLLVPSLSLIAWTSAVEPEPERFEPIRTIEILPHLVTTLPEPVRSVRLRDYLYRLSDDLSDAYADRTEDAWARALRLRHFANRIAEALEADWRIGTMGDEGWRGQSSYASDWKYGATLVWIAHRETRIARNPRLLGNEDNGRAHGAWQIWSWHGQNPFAPETALDMLLVEPGASWSLPKTQPWIGYPACATWIAAHPFE